MLRITLWLQRAYSSPVRAPGTGALGWAVSLKHFLLTSGYRRATCLPTPLSKLNLLYTVAIFIGAVLEMPSSEGFCGIVTGRALLCPYPVLPYAQGRRLTYGIREEVRDTEGPYQHL